MGVTSCYGCGYGCGNGGDYGHGYRLMTMVMLM